jgi:cold shock protein
MNTIIKVKGKVKWFSEEKGFGFLILDGYPQDVFVHKQQLQKSNVHSLKEDDAVICVVNNGPKGNFATNITKV